MSFNDIFKSSFLENVTAVSITDMAIGIVLSFFLGLFIFFVYKKTYAGVMFSQSFGGSLIAMTMITTMVILAVTSNVVLSLGPHVPAEEFLKLGMRHRSSVEVALTKVTSCLTQDLLLLEVFYTLGDRLDLLGLGDPDNG